MKVRKCNGMRKGFFHVNFFEHFRCDEDGITLRATRLLLGRVLSL